MTLLDSNVLIYASDPGAAHSAWARRVIARGVSTDGAAVNAVCLAEIEIVGWRLATADTVRIKTCFPAVLLVSP